MHNNNGHRSFVELVSRFFEGVALRCYDNRLLVLGLCLAVLVIAVVFAAGVRFDNSFEAYFDREDPLYQNFLQFREDFGSDEIAYILYAAPKYEHGPFDISVMERIAELTRALEREVPFVDRALSPANAELIEGAPGELIIYKIEDELPLTQDELLEFRKKLLSKPLLVNALVSRDGSYGAIVLEMLLASIDPPEMLKVDPDKGYSLNNLYPQATFNKIEEILARPQYADLVFYHTADVALNANYNVIAQTESAKLGIIAFLIIGAALVVFFGRPMGVIGPLAVVFLAILLVTGFVGLMGWNFDLMFTILPALMVAVGVADAVHFYSEFKVFHLQTGERRAALARAMYLVGLPCLFTSTTTMAGFASMSISPIKAISHFAVYSAVGVACAFLLTITFLVVLLSFGKSEPSKRDIKQGVKKARGGKVFLGAARWIALINVKRPWLLVGLWSAIFIFGLAGMTRLTVDSNFLNEFSQELPIRIVTEHTDNVMGGAGSFSYVFEAHEPGGIIEPEQLAFIDRFAGEVEKQDSVVMKVNSVTDLLKDINRSFHDEDDNWYILPDSRALAAQYILLYEMSGGDEIGTFLTPDQTRASMEVRCKLMETSYFKRAIEQLDVWLAQNPPPGMGISITGMGALWVQLLEYIVQSQIRGFALAFIVITIMMCVVFQSVRTGIIAMIPNLAPIVVVLGAMGWAGISLDYVKLLIACVAIGIAVDDCVHTVTRFRHEFDIYGTYQEALHGTLRDVGRALFITTAVLVMGFSVTVFSVMDSLVHFGLLVAGAITVALFADFFLLPALFVLTKPFGPERGQ
ncbi:MAG: MMPL family transporter [Desulfatibacillaceae bacterium]|nr:MMPL family transporter [Desulfatibacillaceae bacterium]